MPQIGTALKKVEVVEKEVSQALVETRESLPLDKQEIFSRESYARQSKFIEAVKEEAEHYFSSDGQLSDKLETIPDKASLDETLNRIASLIPSEEKQWEFGLGVTVALEDYVLDLGRIANKLCSFESPSIGRIWHNLNLRTEPLSRRAEILRPRSESEYESALRWMAEQGKESDLEMLRQVKRHPPYPLERLLAIVEEQIDKRVNSISYVREKGEEAYQLNKHEWDQEYAGQFIALYRGQVIAADRDEPVLMDRIMQAQEDRGPFRAYIVEIGAEPLRIRMPHPGRRLFQPATDK